MDEHNRRTGRGGFVLQIIYNSVSLSQYHANLVKKRKNKIPRMLAESGPQFTVNRVEDGVRLCDQQGGFATVLHSVAVV